MIFISKKEKKVTKTDFYTTIILIEMLLMQFLEHFW